jgi:hypothetical protein
MSKPTQLDPDLSGSSCVGFFCFLKTSFRQGDPVRRNMELIENTCSRRVNFCVGIVVLVALAAATSLALQFLFR